MADFVPHSQRAIAPAVLAITLISIALWLPFGFKTTGLVEEWSLASAFNEGQKLFFVDQNSVYHEHATRPLSFAPFNLAYLLDPNSFVGLNLLLLTLFVSRGVFAYLLLRALLPGRDTLAFFAAVIFLLYPADAGWFALRAINVHFAITWYLAAAYLLLVYFEKPNVKLLVLMWAAVFVSVLTYEIVYPVIAITPVLLLYKAHRLNRRVIVTTFLWYLFPILAGLRVLFILLTPATTLYTTSVISQTLRIDLIPQRIVQVYWRSFIGGWAEALHSMQRPLLQLLLGLASAATSLAVLNHLMRRSPIDKKIRIFQPLLLFGFGLAFIILGFSPYLLSSVISAQIWRTFYLPSFGAALCIALLIDRLLGWKRTGQIVATLLVFVASASAYQQHESYVVLSLEQQRLLGEMLQIAPAINGETTVVVIYDDGMIPRDVWHFAYGLHFRHALDYLYDTTGINAFLCASSEVVTLEGQCQFRENEFFYNTPIVTATEVVESQSTPYHDLLVFEYTYENELQLVENLNAYFDHTSPLDYQPSRHILQPTTQPNTRMFSCWPITICTIPPVTLLPINPGRLEFSSEMIVGPGWRGSEVGSRWNNTFRWIGSPIARIPLRLDEQGLLQLEFLVTGWLQPETLDALELFINHQRIPIAYTATEQGVLYTADVPTETVARQEVDFLEFRLPKLDTVSETDMQLGVAIDWMTIVPMATLLPINPGRLEFSSEMVVGPGWRGSEVDSRWNNTFRWTNATRAQVPLRLDEQGPLQLEFLVTGWLQAETLDALQLFINDQRIPVAYSMTERGALYTANVPAGTVARQEVDFLEFRLPKLNTVSGTDIQLGVALDWMTIVPTSQGIYPTSTTEPSEP
jgi:hypothetical protein